jgi:hypothetical protein
MGGLPSKHSCPDRNDVSMNDDPMQDAELTEEDDRPLLTGTSLTTTTFVSIASPQTHRINGLSKTNTTVRMPL